MTGLAALGQVALREISERVRSKAYLITTGLTVLIVLGLIVAPTIFGSDTTESTVGTVGEGNEVIISTAVDLGNANDEPDQPPSVAIETVQFEDREQAETALENGEVDAVLVDGNEVIVESVGGFNGNSLVSGLQQAAGTVQIQEIVEEEGQQATDIIEILTSDPLETTTLTAGDPEEGDSRTLIAYFGLLLLYLAVLLYGTWILTGVTEEKSNRVVEVLLSSVRPWQILGGKILGIGSLALFQLLGTIAIALVALRVTGAFDLPPIEIGAVLNLLLWFVVGFLIFAVLFGAAGSLVSRTEEANTIAMPMSMAAVVGFFVSISALNDPDGVVATIFTFVPITAPFVVPVRTALQSIPAWQYILALVICVASIGVLTVLAGRIYAGGLLRYGGRVGVREAWQSAAE
ncbi:MAG TPA: ABC transporter permease [Acidimicrobiia bacterium]|nr:ABC transporter permease [Acidimicrobiia bacterium]